MEGGHHRGEKRPALAPSPVQSCWVIKGKKNESLYLSGAGQESSAAVIKILSSPVKDTYRSSSATRSLFVKENQLNRWGLSFHSSCKSPRLPPGSLKTGVGAPRAPPACQERDSGPLCSRGGWLPCCGEHVGGSVCSTWRLWRQG